MKQIKPLTRERSSLAEIATRNLLDSRRLFYFFHVARLGSFTTAEVVLDIAQSAISRQVQQLEVDVGQQLLERTGRGVSLTEAGQLLYRQAETILQEMENTIELLDLDRRRPSGQVSIATPPIFSSLYMPEVVRRFVETFPEVQLTAHEASTGQVYEYLTAGKVDMAIVLHASNSQKVQLQKLAVEPLLLIAASKNPVATRTSISRADLVDLDIVLPVSAHGSRALVESYCEEGGVKLETKLRLDSMGMTKAVIKQGRFCAIWPRIACAAELAAGEMVALPLSPPLTRTTYLATMRERPLTAYGKAMAREIAGAVRTRIQEGAAI